MRAWIARIMIMSGTWPRRTMNMKLPMKTTVDTARMRSVLYLLFCMAAQEPIPFRQSHTSTFHEANACLNHNGKLCQWYVAAACIWQPDAKASMQCS